MSTVMELRQQAIRNGETTFNTGRPCRKNHTSDRYTSNGICIQCTKENNTAMRTALAQAATRANLINQANLTSVKVSVHFKHQSMLEDLADIMAEGGQRADDLAAFILMIGKSTLDREALMVHLKLDEEGIVRNPTRTGTSGKYEAELYGEWYLVSEIFELKRGDRQTIHRVPPPLKLPADLSRIAHKRDGDE